MKTNMQRTKVPTLYVTVRGGIQKCLHSLKLFSWIQSCFNVVSQLHSWFHLKVFKDSLSFPPPRLSISITTNVETGLRWKEKEKLNTRLRACGTKNLLLRWDKTQKTRTARGRVSLVRCSKQHSLRKYTVRQKEAQKQSLVETNPGKRRTILLLFIWCILMKGNYSHWRNLPWNRLFSPLIVCYASNSVIHNSWSINPFNPKDPPIGGLWRHSANTTWNNALIMKE